MGHYGKISREKQKALHCFRALRFFTSLLKSENPINQSGSGFLNLGGECKFRIG
jgi:hypothetical protein